MTNEPMTSGTASTFRDICNEMMETNVRKSGDYGPSYTNLFAEFGDVAAIIPLQNKLDRIKNLVRRGKANNESLADSVLDLACYAAMYLVELRKRENEQN